MEAYKVEYLIVLSSTEPFCKTENAFNNLLQSFDAIKISDSKIRYEKTAFEYKVKLGLIAEGDQRYFHVTLVCKEPNNLEVFKVLLKAVRTILKRAGDKPAEILWDDVSSELSNAAYPVVHNIENMMRKLLTKFMYVKIGLGWIKDAVPKEVSDSIRTKNTLGQNYLHETDFIQLSNFLFKEYLTANARKLVEKVGKAKDISEFTLEELRELVPRSNWERYFAPVVECKSEYLKSRWERLYILRCLVAHNNFMTGSDYDEIIKVSSEVRIQLEKALEALDGIAVSDDEREDVAENIATSMSSDSGDFIALWSTLVDLLYELAIISDNYPKEVTMDSSRIRGVGALTSSLLEGEVISSDIYNKVRMLFTLRNVVVHQHGTAVDLAEIQEHANIAREVVQRLRDIRFGLINPTQG